MILFLAIVQMIIAVLLVVTILMQDAKGGGAFGMSGGGGSNTIFGSTGASNFLVKVTRWLGASFVATCILLTFMTTKTPRSVTDDYLPTATEEMSAPAEMSIPQTDDADRLAE